MFEQVFAQILPLYRIHRAQVAGAPCETPQHQGYGPLCGPEVFLFTLRPHAAISTCVQTSNTHFKRTRAVDADLSPQVGQGDPTALKSG